MAPDFRTFVHQRLGFLGLALLDARLENTAIKSLVGMPARGSRTAYLIKTTVRRIKLLAVEFGLAPGRSRVSEQGKAEDQGLIPIGLDRGHRER